jgi:Zn-dependent protease with chaperone function
MRFLFFLGILFVTSLVFAENLRLEDYFSSEEIARSRAYYGRADWQEILDFCVFFGVIGLLLATSLHLKIDHFFDRLYDGAFGSLGEVTKGLNLDFGILPRLLFKATSWVFFLALLLNLVNLPVVYLGYQLQTDYGLNERPFLKYYQDSFSGYGLTLVKRLGAAFLFVLFFNLTQRWWWIFYGIFMILIPFFQDYFSQAASRNRDGIAIHTSLPQGSLRTKLEEAIQKTKLPVSDIKIRDDSKRTKFPNGWVLQAWDANVIFFTDTCLPPAFSEEALVNLAIHELGHIHYKHNDTRRFWNYVMNFGVLAFTALLLNLFLKKRYKPEHRTPAHGTLAYLVCFYFLIRFVQTLVAPVWCLSFQHQELQAEQYALEISQDPTGIIELRKKMALQGITRLDSHFFWFLETHPNVLTFFKVAEDYRKKQGARSVLPESIPPKDSEKIPEKPQEEEGKK